MTTVQAQRIADAAVALRAAERDLAETERINADVRGARVKRRTISAAEAELNAAIDDAVGA